MDRLQPVGRDATDVRPLRVLGLAAFLLYRPLSPAIEIADKAPEAPLGPSKKLVYGMAALFGMDSFGTGFLVQSMLALWLY
jgi:hypothetical protein